jgi:hypothetical protein
MPSCIEDWAFPSLHGRFRVGLDVGTPFGYTCWALGRVSLKPTVPEPDEGAIECCRRLSEMPAEIQPAQWVQVKVKARPTSAAAEKTMIRLFEKDEEVHEKRKRLQRVRPVKRHIRGGRWWYDRPPRLRIVSTEPGATYKLFGSVDVLRDLSSLDRFVEVTPA